MAGPLPDFEKDHMRVTVLTPKNIAVAKAVIDEIAHIYNALGWQKDFENMVMFFHYKFGDIDTSQVETTMAYFRANRELKYYERTEDLAKPTTTNTQKESNNEDQK